MKPTKFQGVLAGLLLLPLGISANPTGGSVAAGGASIGGQGTGAVTVKQTTPTAIINWQTFSIGAGETTTFLQPSAASAVLNRVLGGETSIIDGTLTANGQVYLVNGNGIVVGPDGVVNANAFTASTRDITNADFLAGKLHFTGSNDAGVQNLGTISALGGNVVLIGKTVDNEGSISAPNGTAGLVAGDDVLLAQKNADGSTIKVTASATASGANGLTGVRNGGTIAAAAAELKAANGNIYALAIQNSGTIRASTVAKQGGHIWLMSDTGTVSSSGTLDASPTKTGGKGGAIETSGEAVGVSGTVTAGKGGMWLIDPADVTLDNGASPFPDVNVTTLGNTLSAGTDTTINASGNNTNSGVLQVYNDVNWTGDATLTLTAKGNVNVNANITSDLGNLNLVADNTGTGIGTVTFNGGAVVTTAGNVNIYYNPSNPGGTVPGTINTTEYTTPTDFSGDVAGGATLTAFMLVNNVFDLQNVGNNLSGNFAQGKNIDASATATWNPVTTGTITTSYNGFIPIGDGLNIFEGIFNGNGFTINNLTVNHTQQQYAGLFGNSSGTLENVTMVGSNITGNVQVGALTGFNTGTVTNCSSSGTVTGVLNSGNVGGLVGGGVGTIENSHTSGLVVEEGGGDLMGGLAGDVGGVVFNCYSTAEVMAGSNNTNFIGGLLGGSSAQVTQSYSTGAVVSSSFNEYIGGLVGSNSGTIDGCYSTGAVSGSIAAGLVGNNDGTVSNSYSTSAITNGSGLVANNAGLVQTSYYAGRITVTGGVTDIGTIVGFNQDANSITDCFWDENTMPAGSTVPGVGSGDGSGVVGATTAQLSSPSFIAAHSTGSWDFTPGTGNWGISGFVNNGGNTLTSINGGLPFLPWQVSGLVAVMAADQHVTYTGLTTTLPNPTGFTITGDSSLLLSGPTISIAPNNINAGTYAITVNAVPQVGDAVELINGTFTINQAPLTVTANDGSITYKGTGFTGGEGVTYSGFVNNQGPGVLGGNVIYTGSSQGAVNVGDYVLTPSGLVSSNYAITYVPGTLTITPAQLTVQANSPTLTYNGQAFNSPSVTYLGLKGSDTPSSVLSGTVSYTGNGIGATNAGSYTITPGGLTLNSNNYTLAFANGTLTITPAVLTVTVKAGTSVYGQDVATDFPVPGLTITGLVGNDTAASVGFSSLITGTGNGITSTTDAGKYNLTIGGSLTDANYVLKNGTADPAGKTTTWTVARDVLTISGLTGTSIYGQTPATPANGYTLTSSNGITNQATLLALLTGAPTTTTLVFNIDDTTNAGKYNTDQILTTPGLANGVNPLDYTIKTVKQGVWTVTPDIITIAGLTNGSSTYGFATGFDPSTYFDITDEDNTLNVDDLVMGAKGSLTAKATSNAGVYATGVTGKLATGVSKTNYKIVFQKGTWTITPQAVDISIVDGVSTYGSKPGTPQLTATGMVNGKAVTLGNSLLKGYSTDQLAVIGDKSQAGAGQYEIDLTGAGTGNYVAANPNEVGTWTVAPATISAITIAKGAKSVYGNDPTNTGLKVTGLVNGDTPSVLGYTLIGTGGQLTAMTDASTTPYTFTVGGGLTDANYVLKSGITPPTNLAGAITITPRAADHRGAERHIGLRQRSDLRQRFRRLRLQRHRPRQRRHDQQHGHPHRLHGNAAGYRRDGRGHLHHRRDQALGAGRYRLHRREARQREVDRHAVRRPSAAEALRTALDEVRAVYRELDSRPVQRACVRRTECCQFKLTGRTPMLTRGEAILAARALRASGRKALPEREDGACPMLRDNGACMIYADRPFGCRTHFCAAAGGPYARAEVLDLIRRLEALDTRLEGRGPRALEAAVDDEL